MGEEISPLKWSRNPVYLTGLFTLVFFIIFLSTFFSTIFQRFYILDTVLLILFGLSTFIFYKNQCPKCKRVFHLRKTSNEVLKQWEEPKQYNEKTIYYYSDGFNEKEVKNGYTKTFIAKYEKHKDGFKCNKCEETFYKIRDIFVNKDSWLRVTTPNKIVTNAKAPRADVGFGMDSFEPTYYQDKSGKRKSIPKQVKKMLWEKYNGKNYKDKCFVCGCDIDTHNFEAGHVIAASRGGSDNISNLRPICRGCNSGMSNMNLNEYKKKYHSER